MIANIAPNSSSFDETINTLKYADRAKNIKTTVTRNVVSVNYHISGECTRTAGCVALPATADRSRSRILTVPPPRLRATNHQSTCGDNTASATHDHDGRQARPARVVPSPNDAARSCSVWRRCCWHQGKPTHASVCRHPASSLRVARADAISSHACLRYCAADWLTG
jgi:hypothetical protein